MLSARDAELAEWVEPLRELAGESESVYAMFNNNGRSAMPATGPSDMFPSMLKVTPPAVALPSTRSPGAVRSPASAMRKMPNWAWLASSVPIYLPSQHMQSSH